MHKRFAIAACAASLVFPCVSLAADELAAVVVTATRFAGQRDQLPVGAIVITARDMAESGLTSIADILSRLGAVHLRNNAGDPNPQFDLRGFGMTGDQNTLVLLDGIRISENEQTVARLSAVPLDAIERIEILPGSGAVLYGAGATAGTINIVTRSARPGATSGRAAVGAGSFGTRTAQASLSTASDRIGLTLNASSLDTDNYRRNNKVKEQNLDGAVRAPFSGGEAFVKFGGSRQRLGMPGPLTMAQIAADPRAASSPNDHGFTDTARLAIGGKTDLGFGEFAADLAWRDRDTEGWFAAGGGTSHTGAQALSFTPRLRLPYHLGERDGTLVVGADLSRATLRRVINQPLWFWFSDLEAQQNDRASYFHNSLQLAAATRVTLGARWQHSDYDQTERIAPVTRTSQSRPLRAWELGLRQGLSAGFDAYARLGTSFRVANIDDNGGTLSGQLLLPQTSRDAEAGLEWRHGRDRMRVAAFESRIENEIHFMNVPGAGFFNGGNTNLPPTRHRGIEVDAAGHVGERLSLNGNYRLTSARFVAGSFSGVDVSGREIPLVPRQRATMTANYRLDDTWSASGSLQYVGSQRYDNDQANSFMLMPAYTLLDVKLAWQARDWKLSAGIDNLTDKRYYSYGIRNNAATSFNAYPEAGRRIMLTAGLAFR
ncbi:MAG: TonB-dependent receptor [Sulfuritalea sp.]|nr:TonB-dependent receptor [Sulfuritalea sp.]